MAAPNYRLEVKYNGSSAFDQMIRTIQSPELRSAMARGVSEHADEQKRQSVTRIAATTGVPKSRINTKTKVIRASSMNLTATVRTADEAISLGRYGRPSWNRSMPGTEATGWNVRRIFRKSFMIGSEVYVRTTKKRKPLKKLHMAVLANELAKPSRPNVAQAESFAVLDLEKRVTRHVTLSLGI